MKRIYRILLRFYPARFREEYATLMEHQFSEEYSEACGPRGRVRFLLRAGADIALTLPSEIAHEFRRDLGYAVQVYRQRCFTTLLALTTLALAIGASTGIFSVLNAFLIRSLPFREPEKLVQLWLSPVTTGQGRPAFHAWRDTSPYLADAAGYCVNEMNLGLTGESARVRVAETTANFLALLGTEPEYGRDFAADEDIPGRDAVAIVSHGLWEQYFGGEPDALGKTIRLNGVPFTIVGVAPQTLDYPEKSAIWTPTIYDLGRIPKAGAFGWDTIGRLRPGITLAKAAQAFDAEVTRAEGGQHRPAIQGNEQNPRLISLRDRLAGNVRSASLVLMGMVVLVLLIACANVAQLFLSRTTERRGELAIRAALGASRARLVQQLVTEAVFLTLVAAAVGLLVANWTARLAANAQPSQLSARPYTILDWRVLAFALGTAVFTGLFFGILPASLMGNLQPRPELMRTDPGSGSLSTRRLRSILIGMQTALAVCLAVGALTMGRTFLKLVRTDLGFRTDHTVTLNVSLSGTRYENDNRELQYYSEALENLRTVPGVESVAAVSNLPLVSQMLIAGRYKLDSGPEQLAALIAASPGYFNTIGTPLIAGREFTWNDRAQTEPVVIISDTLARSFGTTQLIGRKVNIAREGQPRWATIIGVVKSERSAGPECEGGAVVFRPLEQSHRGSVTFVARVRGRTERYLSLCRAAVQRVDPAIPAFDAKSLEERLKEKLASQRFYTTSIIFFAAFALLLAVTGVYGVATYSIAQRRHEIGVRIAVGATPQAVRRTLVWQAMVPVAEGTFAGILGAAASNRLLQHFILSAEPAGAGTWLSAGAILATASAMAVWTASDRIVHMDAAAALRAD